MKLILTLFAALVHLTAFSFAQSVQSTFPQNFNLAALNTTLPNANTTGAPLVLGATGGVTVYTTSTWNSFPYGSLNTFGLVNNALRAYLPDGTWAINGTSVTQGGTLTWIASRMYPAPQEQNAVYSVVTPPESSGSAPLPTLAAYDRADLWSLCPDKNGNYPQTRLVYNVASIENPPSWLPFDPASCYGVVVNVVAV
ncbi:hypothetical protein H1R20_g9259, partial [Candolleomyces eurysporus]